MAGNFTFAANALKMKIPTLITFLFVPLFLFAQLPATNVYLFNYRQINDSSMVFYRPQVLTDFNKNGYNNQPSFFGNDELYLSVQTADDTTQTDIYKLSPSEKKKYRVTKTQTPEYSPTLMPDGKHFSVVRVETDGRQRLWKLPLDRSTNGQPILPAMDKIGYHFWLNDSELALFNVGKTNSFSIANLNTGNNIKLATSVGRCFQKTANGNLAYVFKATESTWIVQEMDLKTKKSTRLIKTLDGAEDFVILNDGTFIMGHGSTLYKFHPAYDIAWLPVADFGYYGIKNITRLAVNQNNRIAIVSN